MTRHINFQEKNSLIAYFSRTGNTEVIAKMIQEKINGDIFRIETVTPYPEDYDEATRVAKNEQKSNARPE
ncbi:MAG: flavodoxin, partial [Candidatus Hodarchaeota archaeon]